MIKSIKQSGIVALLSAVTLLSSAAHANDEISADDRYFYIGTEYGISDPVVNKFQDKDTKTDVEMKRSTMYGGRIGYSFYPGMMIEISATHQPKYKLGYVLHPDTLGLPKAVPGTTDMSTNVFTANLIYELPKKFAQLQPYVIFGAGVSRISIKSASSSVPGPQGNMEIFRIKNQTANYFTYQLGVGVTRDLGANLSLDLGARVQVVNNLKLKYDALDKITHVVKAQKPIKKTIAVGEFTIGLTFKIPVK
ncbi:MAG: hypothetical protein COA94_01480 [Rickettsiales bacterium]|nr:MAG: hypothetical protein COA94_01480 [Rickettsiales bacterium]